MEFHYFEFELPLEPNMPVLTLVSLAGNSFAKALFLKLGIAT